VALYKNEPYLYSFSYTIRKTDIAEEVTEFLYGCRITDDEDLSIDRDVRP